MGSSQSRHQKLRVWTILKHVKVRHRKHVFHMYLFIFARVSLSFYLLCFYVSVLCHADCESLSRLTRVYGRHTHCSQRKEEKEKVFTPKRTTIAKNPSR